MEAENYYAPPSIGPDSRVKKRSRNKSRCLIPSSGTKSCKWTFSEERYFFEHLRIAFNRSLDECAKDIAHVLRTKSEEDVRKYYSLIVRRIMKYAAPDANLEQYATANIHRSMIFYWDTVLLPCRENKKRQVSDKEDDKITTSLKNDSSPNETPVQAVLRHPSLQFDDKQVENIKDPAADERENNCGADGKHLASSSKFNLLANNLNNSQGKLNDRSKSKKSKKLVDSPCEGGKGEAQVKKDANCHAHQFEPATTEFKVLKVNPPYEETAVQLEAASLAKDVHLDKPTTTPAKPKAPHETEPDPILRFQTESWACLSPPPNFELPQDFHKETGGLDAFITHSFGGCSILLPSNSLLEAGDKIGKPVGNSANVIRKGIEALFMQVKEDKGNPSTDEFQPTKSHAEHDLFNYGILKEGLTNSSWLLEFERNQSERQEKPREEKPKNNGRPFAALFGNDG